MVSVHYRISRIFQFRRYHQSEIILRGRSCIKEGWWAGGMEVQVQGQSALIKRYDDPKAQATRKWLRDVKMLQTMYHPNLPQMLGFSDEETATPFILLANVKTQTPEATVREILRTKSLATCMELMLRFVSIDFRCDTAMYVQRQLNLTDNQVQDFFEAAGFRVDSQKTLVVGLPPPREGTWYSARNYGLSSTLLGACLKMLPNQGRITYSYDKSDEEVTEDMQKKINHLVTLARSLLPSDREAPGLPPKLQEIIEDNDFDTPSLTLRQVRDLTFHAGGHEHSWYERNVPACKFAVGDLGYIPRGKDWHSFVRLGNAVENDAETLKLSFRAKGDHWCWKDWPMQRKALQAFEMPMNVSAWPVAVPAYQQIDVAVTHEAFAARVKDAWQYLLENGKRIAEHAGIKPEDIVLGGTSLHRPASKSLLTHSSDACRDASRFLHQRLPTATVRNEPTHADNLTSVRGKPVPPPADARVPPPFLRSTHVAVDHVSFHLALSIARTLLVVLSGVHRAGK
ncbi:hypothetical protein J3R82DRAFT_8789 [Butyriboletus roseoflavus]|nr:hypothetical protein J3R82DRAFT_8789 [Butyriboletus roseoflavus]